MTNRNQVRLSKLAFGLAVALAAAPAFAQNTSSAVGGRIVTGDGAPIAGAQVTITHTASGAVSKVVTGDDGRYAARGLRVGGPYTITITKDGKTETRENVFLPLASTAVVDATIGQPAATTLATVEVVGVSGGPLTPFDTLNMGAGTTIVKEQIEQLPSIRRSIEDYVRLDSRVVQVDEERGGIAVAGQNNRYNNIRIDGVPTNDQFGLNDSGLPSLNQPISIDWIQEFNVGISDYDSTQTDFVGANINAVTKSGGNDFSGAAYIVYRNDDWVGDKVDGQDRPPLLLSEKTRGAYLGGPLIQDKLFFFVGYEKYERSGLASDNGIAGSGALNEFRVTQDQIDQIKARAAQLGQNDIGEFQPIGTFTNSDDKWLAKLDWNINDNHRATFRYNKTDGSVLRFNNSLTTLQSTSNQYTDNITFESWAALLYSNWTENFSTEFNIAYAEYDSLPEAAADYQLVQITVPNGSPFNSNATVVFGKEFSRQANQLNTDTITSYLAGNLFVGDHELKFGADFEQVDVFNLFLQSAVGTYSFDNIADFQAGNWSRYQYQRSNSGDINDVAANFDVGTFGLFAQDTWTINSNLTLIAGVRADQSLVGGSPAGNARFVTDFGINNRNTPDGDWLVQPRVGFNYTFDSDLRSQLRGGAGLFRGSAPGVWISNSFSNTGVFAQSFDIRTTSSTRIPGVSLDPNAPFVPTGASPSQLVNALDNGFAPPSVWRANLAFEQELPVFGLIAGVEVVQTEVNDAVHFENLALGEATGVLPDGRLSYWNSNSASGFNPSNGNTTGSNRVRSNCILVNPAAPFNRTSNPCAYTDAILLTNTSKGSSTNTTLSLEKPWKDNWYAKVAYTRGHSEEVSPGTSSVALSNWQNRVVANPNEETLRTSNYEVKDRLTASFSYRFEFFGENAPTTVSAFYEGRFGRPYSYTFSNDANGDGRAGNDVFSVPTIGDVSFTGFNAVTGLGSSAADQAAFFQYIANTPGLRNHEGGLSEINGQKSPWRNQLDIRISQDIPLGWNKAKAQFFFDIENFTNLLNKKWGGVEEANFPYTVNVARFQGVDANGNIVLDVSGFVNEATGAVSNPALPFRNFESRWAAQAGLRIEF